MKNRPTSGKSSSRNHADSATTTVYFDGSCPLCNAEISHYASRDRNQRLRFVDVSQVDSDPGADLSREAAMQRFHVRTPDGNLASGAHGFVALWQALPGWRWLAKIARAPGVTPLLELIYRLFLPARPSLSRAAVRLGAKPAVQQTVQSRPVGDSPVKS
ncbi:MAG: DUF393 domain-containing protein [Pseudomonadota bacterium]